MYMCDIQELTSCEKLDNELSFETRHIEFAGRKVTIIVYDEANPPKCPIFKANRLLAKGLNAFAVVISSKATLEDCEHLAGELLPDMGIQIEAGCELHKKACNELGEMLLKGGN